MLLRSPAENWPKCRIFLGGAQLGFPRPSVVGRPAEGAGEADDGDGDAAGAVFGVCSRVSLRMPAGPPAQSLRFRLKGAMGEWEGESPLRIGNVGMRCGGEKLGREREERGRNDLILRGSANASELFALTNMHILRFNLYFLALRFMDTIHLNHDSIENDAGYLFV